jgi:predicted permease
MTDMAQTTRFRWWLRLIRLIGVIVPRRLRADWRQEWEAELAHRESVLADWDRLDWRHKLNLLWRSTSAFWDALWMQTYRWEDEISQDLRFGARMLVKHKGFTLVAVLSLALGIGANTAIFSLMDVVLLKMLPVEEPEQLYFIDNVGARGGGGAPPYPCFERFREQNQSFNGLAAFTRRELRIRIDGEREEITAQFVSGNYFPLLGVRPLLGRALSLADDTPSEQNDGYVAVISYNYWTRRFGRSTEVIGKVAQIGNDSVTIIGITPPEFYGLFPGAEMDISLPLSFEGGGSLASNRAWWFYAVGRLKPYASVQQAQAELNAIFQRFMAETSVSAEQRRDSFDRIELTPASRGLDTLRRRFSRPLLTLMGMVALVLLIACANVANLLLARATARRREFAMRLALGASRWRLVRQMLTESLLLVSLGGVLGLLFARWSGAFLTSFFASGSDRLSVNMTLDYRVLLFTAGIALLTGMIFGLAPAWQATLIDTTPALKDGAATITCARSRFGKSLVVIQVALSLLLLVGAGLFVQTLNNLKNIDPGFLRDGVVTMRVNPSVSIYQGVRLPNLWQEILARVGRLPGVRAASLSTLTPLGAIDSVDLVEAEGFTPDARHDQEVRLNQVSPGFFQTFGIGLSQGRGFNERDSETAPKVALLNETAARFYFGDQRPIGAKIRFNRCKGCVYQVVGVVKDALYNSLREPNKRAVYVPMRQSLDQLGILMLAVRGEGRTVDLTNAIRQELRSTGKDILLTYVASLDEQIDQSLLQERLLAALSLFFGLLALLLACIGLYGVLSYNVARRTNEIGIRVALGATRGDVLWLVLREGLALVGIGVVSGLIGTLSVSRAAETLLYGVRSHDALTMTVATMLLTGVAAVAGYLPARRATNVDPMIALRRE